jgi:hypothetical protein
MEFQVKIKEDLERRNIAFKILSGDLAERVKRVEEALKSFTGFPAS